MTLFEFKSYAKEKISSSPSQALDIQVLLEHFTGLSKTQLLMNRNQILTQDQINQLEEALSKRQTGLPIAYITGHKEFYGYDFFVSPAVLIPKPDTEILVEKAVEIIIEKMEARNSTTSGNGQILSICDMCTGSGCIGISVLKQLKEEYNIPKDMLPKMIFADISRQALDIAKKNADSLLDLNDDIIRSKVQFVQTNLFEAIPYKFDVILTNPPYIPKKMVDELLTDGRSEPRLALDGDINTKTGSESNTDDGLEIIRELIPQAKEHLSPLGHMIMETGEYNAEQAAELAKKNNFSTELYRDLENQLRGFVAVQ